MLGLALLAVVALPLSGDRWHALQYAGKTPNEITFSEQELRISVKGSASPLFYRFEDRLNLRSVSVKGNLSALPQLPAEKNEGEKGADDLALRFGIVLEGDKKIGWLERLFAPAWLKQLTAVLVDQPFGGVHFLTLSQTQAVGTTRHHPTSPYLEEEVVKKVERPGPFSFEHIFAKAPRTIGLWLQSDGDDTHSSFDLSLHSIILTTKP